MGFSRTHLITFFLLVLIPYATSFTFNLRKIDQRNLNKDIDTFGDGPYISDDGIHLTPDQNHISETQSGWATYHKHLHLWDSRTDELAGFSTNFTFVMNSNGLRHYGDGLTFFLAQNNTVFTPGGAMGLPTNYSNVISPYRFVAVEFDTFWNVWDPLDSSNTSIGDHVGISISSLKSVTYQKWLSNVSGGGECQAWITYDSVSKILSVNFTGYQNNRVLRQDGLAYMVDLRKELPEWVIFGFSAGTGALFQKNDVRSWSFDGSDLEVDKRNEQPPNPLIPNPDPVLRNNINVGLIYWAETQSTG
ncbi:L-type lectin-domain containing receptor kinase IX.1-like protein [Tanacetum coccineum]